MEKKTVIGWRNRPSSERATLLKVVRQELKKAGGGKGAAAKVVAALVKLSPGRAALFNSPEFFAAVEKIMEHGNASQLARLCNALFVDIVTHTTERALRAEQEYPHIVRAANAVEKAHKRLHELRGVMTARNYREDLKANGRLMPLPEVLGEMAKVLNVLADKYKPDDSLRLPPGLTGSNVGLKRGVSLAAAVPAGIAREVRDALPDVDGLRSDYSFIASLMQRAGIKTDRHRVKSACRS